MFGGREEEREAVVFSGELVGVVDTEIAGGAEGSLVGGAEHRRLVFIADVALDLHLGFSRFDFSQEIVSVRRLGWPRPSRD